MPSPSVSPGPFVAYLPLSLREDPHRRGRHADVVLVLDASSSMAGPKLTAAKAAVGDLARSLDLPDDRIAVLSFDEQARVLHALSSDPTRLAGALAALVPRQGTRIDRGLDAALDLLLTEGEPSLDRLPIVILLSDGRQRVGVAESLLTANRMRAVGIELHAVAFGAEADTALLLALTGRSDRLYRAADATALTAAFLALLDSIRCEPEAFWGRRCR